MRLAALLLSALLLLPSTALAQSDGEVCIPEAKARKCATLIEADRVGLLDKLRKAQARLNQANGSLDELRVQYRDQQQHVDDITAKLGELSTRNVRLERRPKGWVVWVVGLGALVAGGAVGWTVSGAF